MDVFIRQTNGVSDPNSKHGDGRALYSFRPSFSSELPYSDTRTRI